MKRLHRALIVASLAVVPFASQLAHAAGLSRDEVRAQLIQSEQNGTYHTSKTHYPDVLPDYAAAYVAKKTAERDAALVEKNAASDAYGPATAGNSDAGAPSARGAAGPSAHTGNLYRGH
jgi:hypothetical protein